MSLRAIALHESISVGKLAELYKSEWNQIFASAPTLSHCPKCRAQFAVFLPSSDDPQNLFYVTTLEDRISKDCEKGKHSHLEIRLEIKHPNMVI